MSGPHTRARATAVTIIALGLIVSALSFLAPVAHTVHDPFQAHLRTAIALMASVPFVGAGIWLLTSLRRFKSGLRFAYILLATGIIMLSLGLAQLPVLGLFDLWTDSWATSAGIMVLFVGGALLVYTGIHRVARLLSIKSWLISAWGPLVTGLAFGLVTYIVSPSLVRKNVEGISTYLAAIAFVAAYLMVAAMLAYRVATTVGASYRRAMSTLALGISLAVFGTLHEYLETYIFYEGTTYVDYGYYLWPFVIMGFVMVIAAREFAVVGESSAIASDPATALSDQEYIDNIVAAAALVSRPADIDPILADLRAITSRLDPGAVVLSADDKKRLLVVYGRLEGYLTDGKDPLRIFTTEQVREQLNPGFTALLRAR